MTHICVMSYHKPIRIYTGGLILGVNTLYRLFCFFKLFPMVGKGLKGHGHDVRVRIFFRILIINLDRDGVVHVLLTTPTEFTD